MLDWNTQRNEMALGNENCKKAAKWNPSLSNMHQTNRPVGRPKKRCQDEIHDFLKPDET